MEKQNHSLQFVVVENPIKFKNIHSKLKQGLFAAGFTSGITVGVVLSTNLEHAGFPRSTLVLGCIALLVFEMKFRRVSHKVETEFVNKYQSGTEITKREKLKIHIMQILEVTLLGLNGGMVLATGERFLVS